MKRFIVWFVRYCFAKHWGSLYANRMRQNKDDWNWKLVNDDIQDYLDKIDL